MSIKKKNNVISKKDIELIKEKKLDDTVNFFLVIRSFEKENNQIFDIDFKNKILRILDSTKKEVLLILNEKNINEQKVELIALYNYIFNY